MFHFRTYFLLAVVIGLMVGCGDRKPAPRIDPSLGYRLAVETAAAGVRPSGSIILAKQAEWIAATAKEYGAEVTTETFIDSTPQGDITFRNIIATVPGDSDRYVLIGCHYDTKKMASNMVFVGANDGASGVGALLSMIKATKISKQTPHLTLRFVFFDGEECLYQYGPDDGLHGSRYHAAQLEKRGEINHCRAMILLDMIGDRDLDFTIPENTDPELLRLMTESASQLGLKVKIGRSPGEMTDDHVPFQKKGIPAIDLIDFDFGPGNAWWHTAADTIDKIAPASIAAAADLALSIAWKLR